MNAAKIIEGVKNADNLHLTGNAYWRSVVLATLDAIREPNLAILDEGIAARAYDSDTIEIWQAMIDALKREVAG